MTVDQVDLQVLLGGVDVTDKINLADKSIVVESQLNELLDEASFELRQANTLSASVVRGWNEFVVKNGIETIFGGYLMTKDKKAGSGADEVYECSAADYSAYLDKVFVTKEYTDQTDQEIIEDVFLADELADYDVSSYVHPIRTIPRVVFSRYSVRQVLNWLVEQSGGNWNVDQDKSVHYFGGSEDRAPYDITSNPAETSKETAQNVILREAAEGVVNIIEVIGGNALGGDDTFAYTKTGYSNTLQLDARLAPWNGENAIIVRRNDGGETTNLQVNPSFENNITDGWTQYQVGSGAVWAQDTAKYNKGTKSAKITAGTAMSMLRGASISLAPGEPISAQAMSWCATVGMSSVVIYDVSNSAALEEISNRKTSTWEKLSISYRNTSAVTMTVRIELRNNAVDSTLPVYFDGVQAEKLAWPSSYCDGTLGDGYAWTGTAHNSTSTRLNIPVWTTMTVKRGNNDALTTRDEVLYHDQDGRLEQEVYWPTLSNAIEIDGQTQRPVRIEVRNYASYEFYGKWMKDVIVDSSIVDLTVARMRAVTELAQRAFETETASFDVLRSGLRAGQTINVDIAHRGLSGDYLIRSVHTEIGVGGYSLSNVSIGAIDNDLIKVLLKLKRDSQKTVDLTSDERIEQTIFEAENVSLTETEVSVSGHTGVYRYGDGCRYGFAKYG